MKQITNHTNLTFLKCFNKVFIVKINLKILKINTYFFSFLAFSLLKGGADTGFRRVLPEEYVPRLFHVKKVARTRITCTEVSMKKGNLKSGDVFIIDNGNQVYQVRLSLNPIKYLIGEVIYSGDLRHVRKVLKLFHTTNTFLVFFILGLKEPH